LAASTVGEQEEEMVSVQTIVRDLLRSSHSCACHSQGEGGPQQITRPNSLDNDVIRYPGGGKEACNPPSLPPRAPAPFSAPVPASAPAPPRPLHRWLVKGAEGRGRGLDLSNFNLRSLLET
jgi:hypothetical protein